MIRQTLTALKREDVLLWSAKIGRMHSRNNIVTNGDSAFVSTSGNDWNAADSSDGIYRISVATGEIVWFCPTDSDANELEFLDNVLLVGTDQGKAFAIDPLSGHVIQQFEAASPIYTRALEVQRPERKVAVLISSDGQVIQFDFLKRSFSSLGRIPERIRANPTALTSSSFLAGSEAGTVFLVDVGGEEFSCREVFQLEGHKASGSADYSLEIKGISSIKLCGERAVISYARDTYDRRPPMSCFSVRTWEKLWDAGRMQNVSRNERQDFGNSRVTPAVWDDLVISTFSYDESVHAFSLKTGKWIWRQRLDQRYFQNWSSPVVHGDRLYVARVNGVLSIVDLKKRKLVSSYSVEVIDVSFEDDEATATDLDPASWPNKVQDLDSSGPVPRQFLVAGICSTPVILEDRILVGTVSGRLCCLRQA